jgi:hypothetical protein
MVLWIGFREDSPWRAELDQPGEAVHGRPEDILVPAIHRAGMHGRAQPQPCGDAPRRRGHLPLDRRRGACRGPRLGEDRDRAIARVLCDLPAGACNRLAQQAVMRLEVDRHLRLVRRPETRRVDDVGHEQGAERVDAWPPSRPHRSR